MPFFRFCPENLHLGPNIGKQADFGNNFKAVFELVNRMHSSSKHDNRASSF